MCVYIYVCVYVCICIYVYSFNVDKGSSLTLKMANLWVLKTKVLLYVPDIRGSISFHTIQKMCQLLSRRRTASERTNEKYLPSLSNSAVQWEGLQFKI